MVRPVTLVFLVLSGAAVLSALDCDCDLARPESMRVRQCSLCNEAEKQPEGTGIFFLKDINPRKPNRWLALPRAHGPARHDLSEISHAERTALWTAAIEKAKSLWGKDWGLAYNGETTRTQCHMHLHIGKLLKGVETRNVITVRRPSEIPARPGEGVWVHGVGGKLHVHLGEQITETVLLR